MSGPEVAASALAGLAVLLCFSPRPPGAMPEVPTSALLILLALGGLVAVARLPASRLALAAIVVMTSADLLRVWRRRRRAAAARGRRARVLSACELLAADVRAGLAPQAALLAAAERWPALAAVARASELGADVPEAFRRAAGAPGAGSLRVVAAAWQVAHRSGAGLAPALDLAAATLREERDAAAVVATELASARATALLLAVLPVGVLLLGAGLGGNPWHFLLDTLPGLMCLAAGLVLTRLGLAWIDAIADGVQR